ncbi:MAG: hypothetical protein A3I44_01905 [Candidatus Sungbacteria bacterium RIFCSPLOWO2_02_FULL_51_17]|uniref:Protease PrsW n=1 Tax=Candidatus Sungbacteria bacterium RIFCSPHIGHO2_02_FULL_51_29 TaxID=1802273 RepID=A0A1G2KQM7_9BACT|nr:MAG: hypothetical protein A2676_04040 [Candidatus Sungbacteria bacterium RIFCSPHIGHO2_01_FULL_51_22]OHA01730.1 MAG: hypothetical protein A3C16_04520 [Candidatus Sungbacteria bacterium RIFCSPHIGHO2_02_FULL_51_29]OHA07850.1 MAG: hypothetical protein A3B29_00760 [Candidatus Sungbacteria bacterium RIFCSPLOWO2_01_FULL_51_34]OHA11416.1 MAG: hypothetical protein A3I44_01905 [Candidatus Sungbacteria bacterium RIFCSPLOWO2_02_FULL_51_17]
MAAVGFTTTYIFISFLPPLLWLLFYLHEDRNPEPRIFILLVFAGGIASALLAVLFEVIAYGDKELSGVIGYLYPSMNFCKVTDAALGIDARCPVFLFFLGIAVIEEYVKYLAVKFLVLHRKVFDEPIDAMIYMITAALGFAAIENYFFLSDVFRSDIPLGLQLAASRFIGANLLHALSSGIVGYFLARAFFSPYRHHFLALGLVTASVLHAFYNYFIITESTFPQGVTMLILLLSTMALVVLVEFERLKRRTPTEAALDQTAYQKPQ